MNNNMWIVLIIGVLVVIVLPWLVKKVLVNKLTTSILKKDFETFDKLVRNPITKFTIMPFNLDFLKLSKAIAKEDDKEIDQAFKAFEGKRLNDKQKLAVFQNAYYHYITKEDGPKAKKYLSELLALKDVSDEAKEQLKLAYEVDIEKSYAKLDETLARYDKAESLEEKLGIEAMLVKMYLNKGDKKEADHYTELLKEHVEALQK